jgi:hypothetical protein
MVATIIHFLFGQKHTKQYIELFAIIVLLNSGVDS